MKRVLLALAAAGGVAVSLSCSSSTSPAASATGTWHVSVASMNSGSVSPTTFDIVVTKSGSAYSGTVPTVAYGSVTMNGGDTVEVMHDTLVAVKMNADTTSMISVCDPPVGVAIFVTLNAAMDSAQGKLDVLPNPAFVAPPTPDRMCASGTVTMHR